PPGMVVTVFGASVPTPSLSAFTVRPVVKVVSPCTCQICASPWKIISDWMMPPTVDEKRPRPPAAVVVRPLRKLIACVALVTWQGLPASENTAPAPTPNQARPLTCETHIGTDDSVLPLVLPDDQSGAV